MINLRESAHSPVAHELVRGSAETWAHAVLHRSRLQWDRILVEHLAEWCMHVVVGVLAVVG